MPGKVDKAILSVYIYKIRNCDKGGGTPKLPDIGIFTQGEMLIYEDGFEEEEPKEHMTAAMAQDNILGAVFDSDSEDKDNYAPTHGEMISPFRSGSLSVVHTD